MGIGVLVIAFTAFAAARLTLLVTVAVDISRLGVYAS